MSRIILRLELTPAAKQALESVLDRTAMTQVAALSRIVEWLASQPDIVRAAVLGHFPEMLEREIAQLVLRQMEGRPQEQALR